MLLSTLTRYSRKLTRNYSPKFHKANHRYTNIRMSASLRDKLDAVADVDIDEEGRYKYVIIKVTASSAETEVSKNIVRGYDWAEYHADIYDSVSERIQPLGLDCECLGGGRILTNLQDKTINVYGYSMGFGRGDHDAACKILKTKYPDYEITWSNDGY